MSEAALTAPTGDPPFEPPVIKSRTVGGHLTSAGNDVSIEEFTPDYCAHILDNHNRNPRRLRKDKAEQYAGDMKAGRWAPGLSVIGFDANGDLVDGQHRFAGCIMADVPFSSIVARGVSQNAVDNADRGFKRSVADILRGRGEVSVTALQSALNFDCRWDEAGPLSSMVPTWSQLEDHLQRNPDLRSAVLSVGMLQKPPLSIRGIVACFAKRINRIDEEEAKTFLHRLQTGVGLEKDDAILRLREAFLARRASTYGRPSREHDLALLIKSWNAFITGRKLGTLKWNRGGGRQEGFPYLVDASGRPHPFPDFLRDQARAAIINDIDDTDDGD